MKRCRESTSVVDTLSPLKRLKISTESEERTINKSPSKETRSKKGHHFFTACLQVLTDEYYDVKMRLELQFVPDCDWVNNTCSIHDREPLQVLSYEQEAFKIDVKSGMWAEALDVLKNVTKYNKFPSVDMLNDLIHMILCAVDEKQIFSNSYIIRRCQNLFKMTLETHPPCVEIMRTLYKDFLLSTIKNYENCVYYTDILTQKENLLKTIICMLDKEIHDSESSCNLKDSQKSTEDALKFSNSVDNFSIFEGFEKASRIKRLFIVLEMLTDLLEKDLAIWIRKYFNNPLKHIVRPRKPLIVWLIWQSRLPYGMVNNFCRDVFKFTCDLIKNNYSSIHVNIGIRLINILFQTFYLSGNSSVCNYPDAGTKCETFSKELFNFIKNENIDFILKFITLLKPKQLRCLLSINIVRYLLKSPEKNFIVLANTIFKACLWNRFKTTTELDMKYVTLPQVLYMRNFLHHNKEKTYLKLRNLINRDEILFNSESIVSSDDVKLDPNDVTHLHFMNVCYLALYYYSDMYNVEKIMERHDDLCSHEEGNNNKLDSPSNSTVLLPLSADCLKQYRLIVKTRRDICASLETVRQESPFVYNLFKRIPLLQFE